MTDRSRHIAELREILAEARADQNQSAAAVLTKQIAELSGIVAPVPKKRTPPPEPADPIAALAARLRATKAQRIAAADGGSHDVAGRLMRLEVDLAEKLAAAKSERAKAPDTATDAEIIDGIVADLLGLPAPLRAAVLARVSGPVLSVVGGSSRPR